MKLTEFHTFVSIYHKIIW